MNIEPKISKKEIVGRIKEELPGFMIGDMSDNDLLAIMLTMDAHKKLKGYDAKFEIAGQIDFKKQKRAIFISFN